MAHDKRIVNDKIFTNLYFQKAHLCLWYVGARNLPGYGSDHKLFQDNLSADMNEI